MNAVAQVVVAVLLILVQVVLEVAEVLHLPVRLVLLVIRVRPEPLLGAVAVSYTHLTLPTILLV